MLKLSICYVGNFIFYYFRALFSVKIYCILVFSDKSSTGKL